VLVEEHDRETTCTVTEGAGSRPITLRSSPPAFFRAKLEPDLLKDERLSFAVLPYSGYNFFNNAGGQRNAVFHLVETEWAAFVDDDDTLAPTFVEDLLTEWRINPLADALIFRMSCEKCFAKVIPRPLEDATNFVLNFVGISFALRRGTVLADSRYHFRDSCGEDFDLLSRLRHARKMIVISPAVLYFVKDYKPAPPPAGESYRRVLIQREEGAPSGSDALFDFPSECSHQRTKFHQQYVEDCAKSSDTFARSSAKKCLCRPCGDWTCYRRRYPDTATMTEAAAAHHYKTVGVLEGRTCMCDASEGWEGSGRLAGSWLRGAGSSAGGSVQSRRPNVACDWGCYKDRYPDLAAMTDVKAAAHYVDYGAEEGRLCTCEMSATTHGQVNAKYEYMLQSSVFQVTLLDKATATK
jgi:hypothetical protein